MSNMTVLSRVGKRGLPAGTVIAALLLVGSPSSASADDPLPYTSATPSPIAEPTPQPSARAESTEDIDRRTVVEDPEVPTVSNVRSQPLKSAHAPATPGKDRPDASAQPDETARILKVGRADDFDAQRRAHDTWHDAAMSGTAPDRYELVIGVGEASVEDALASAAVDSSGAADSSRLRGDFIASEFPRASRGDAIEVATLDTDTVPLSGVLFAVDVRASASSGAEWVNLSLDASGLAYSVGGDILTRLKLVELPRCILSTPDKPECSRGTLLNSFADDRGIVVGTVPASSGGLERGGGTLGGLSARVAASGGSGGSLVVAVADEGGQGGTFAATDLGSSGEWSVAEQSGAFTYALKLSAPPVAAGPTPDLGLYYNSSAVDGRNIARNGQAGLIGEGWSMSEAYIERRYKPCADDLANGYSGVTTAIGAESCWQSPVAGQPSGMDLILSLGGTTTPLIWESGDLYYAQSDPSIRVTRVARSGATLNGDDNGEYFVVRTPDGSTSYLGYGRAPAVSGDASTHAATNSVAVLPVLGDDEGEPGNPGFATQGYRFMLDLVVDVHGNAAVYTYSKYTNHYARPTTPAVSVSYTRAIAPASIEYGMRVTDKDTLSSGGQAQARVTFAYHARCLDATNYLNPLAGQTAACPTDVASAPAAFPDVPTDLLCTGNCIPLTQAAPTFFHVNRLDHIDTAVWVSGAWSPVETHQLIQAMPPTRFPQARALWLDSVFTRGYQPGSTPAHVDTYATRFYGTQLPNRVDWTGGEEDDQIPLDKRRITGILDELGALATVEYYTEFDPSGVLNHCPTQGRNSSEYAAWREQFVPTANGYDCYEIKVAEKSAIYHRYLVKSVTATDTVTDSPDRETQYRYDGDANWAYASDRLYADGEGDRGWTDFRGYQVVRVSAGQGEQRSETINQYFTGMSQAYDGTDTRTARNIAYIGAGGFTGSWPTEDLLELRGYLAASVTNDNNGAQVSATRTKFTLATMNAGTSGALRNAKVMRATGSQTIESDPGTPWSRVTTTATAFTSEGLADTVTTTVTSGSESFTTCSDTDYAFGIRNASGTLLDAYFDAAGWNGTTYIVAPKRAVGYWGACGSGVVTSDVTTYYDGATTDSGNRPTKGLPTRQVTSLNATESTWSETDYDGLGRPTASRSKGVTGQGTVAYARGTDGVTEVTTTNVLNHQSKAWIEPRFGNVTKELSVNGDYTHYRHDGLGLLVAGWAPQQHNAASAPTTQVPTAYFEYDAYASSGATRTTPLAVMSAQYIGKDAAGAYQCIQAACFVRRAYDFYNGFGDIIEHHTVSPGGNGGRIVVATDYDDAGRPIRSSSPFYNSEAAQFTRQQSGTTVSAIVNPDIATLPSYTSTSYDWAGRAVESALHGGASPRVSSTSYSANSVATVDVTGSRTTVVSDALGRVKSQAILASFGGAVQTTTYTYEVLPTGGSRSTVTDHEDNSTTTETDRAGRPTKIVDPNAGTTTYVYDAAGRLATSTSPAIGTVTMAYDALGRILSRTSTLPGGASSSSAAWTYDPAGHKGMTATEMATTVIDGASFLVSKQYGYGSFDRLESTTTTLPSDTQAQSALGDLAGKSYTETFGYDTLGQLTTVTMPSIGGLPAETATTSYNRFGSAIGLNVGSTTLVASAKRDALGRLDERTYGNGVTRKYTWNPVDSSLSTLQAYYTPTGGERTWIQYDEYGRDAAGRVVSVNDRVSRGTVNSPYTLSQCYAYDGLNRLADAWTVNSTGSTEAQRCADDNDSASTWAVDPMGYRASWDYSLTGRIEESSLSLVNGATTSAKTSTYTYSTSSPAAVTSVAHTSGTDTFQYDAAGRMIIRNVGGVEQKLEWDPLSNLVSLEQGADTQSYLYDAQGQRVARIEAGRATAYLGSTEATDPNTATPSQLTAVRYYSFAGATVALRDGAGLSYMFGDVQGSATVTISAGNPATATISRNAYLPYGDTRGGDQITSSDRGWLGQVEDGSSGLTYLNARYYDPVLSRFISPDPLMDPGDPRTLDPYRYADNNPISYSDASGLAPSCSGVPPQYYANCANYAQNTYNYVTGKSTKQATAERNSRVIAKGYHKKQIRDLSDYHFNKSLARDRANEESNWSVAGKGLLNFGGGALNGLTSLVSGAYQNSAGALVYQAVTGDAVPSIPTVGIVGDYDTYKYSSWIGSGTAAVTSTVATAGFGGVAAAGAATARASTGARVLWSGGKPAMAAARNFAESTGGLTLEMTASGRVLTQLSSGFTQRLLNPLWRRASERFVAGAPSSQPAVAFLNGTPRANSVFSAIEEPALARMSVDVVKVGVG